MATVKERTHEILESTRPNDWVSRAVQSAIIALIVLNVAAVILVTVEDYNRRFGGFFRAFEIVSVVLFSIEYVLRVWSCTASEAYSHPVKGRLRYMATPGAIIDLLAILPFFLRFLPGALDLRAIRALRIFRILRLLKIGRFSRSMDIFADVLIEKTTEILITLLVVSIALVFASSMLYYAERTAQPDAFSSIPKSMWWGIITLTTVGYGDVTPATNLGKALGGVIALIGIGLFALPAGILASGFEEALDRRQKEHGEDEDEEDDKDSGAEDDEAGSEEEGDAPEDGSGSEAARRTFCPCCGQRLPEDAREER